MATSAKSKGKVARRSLDLLAHGSNFTPNATWPTATANESSGTVHSPSPRGPFTSSLAKTESSPAHPSPLHHVISPPPPSYREHPARMATSERNLGRSEHGSFSSSYSQSSNTQRTRGVSDASEGELELGLVGSSDYHHTTDTADTYTRSDDSHMPLNPNHYDMARDPQYPHKLTITLTADMQIPYSSDFDDPNAAHMLSQRRISALEEVDSARFS